MTPRPPGQEIVLRTACGCQKVLWHANFEPFLKVALRQPGGMFGQRRFVYHGERDAWDRRIYYEDSDELKWQQRYERLKASVYGVDEGL